MVGITNFLSAILKERRDSYFSYCLKLKIPNSGGFSFLLLIMEVWVTEHSGWKSGTIVPNVDNMAGNKIRHFNRHSIGFRGCCISGLLL